MKKKFLSLALAAVMALGTAFAFTGCDFGGSNNSGSGNQNEQGGNQGEQGGNQGEQGGNQGEQGGNQGEQGGNQGEQGGNVSGDLAQELLTGILNTPIANVALEAKLENMASGASGTFGYIHGARANVTGYLGLTEGLNADLFVDYGSTGGEHGYDLVFARGEYEYVGQGPWEDVEVTASDFDALLDAYKQNADLVLFRSNSALSGVYAAGSSASPADMVPMELIIKLLGNLTSVVGGYEVAEVSGGYTITFDLLSALNTLALNLSLFAGSINVDTTVGSLLKSNDSFLNKTLKGLLSGIKASEILSLPMIPQEAVQALPAAGDADAFDYILTLIQDETLVETLNLAELVPGLKKIEDLTVSQIATLISAMAGGQPLPEEALSAYLTVGKTIATALGEDPLSTIVNLLSGRMGAYLGELDPSMAEESPSLMEAKASKLAVTLNFNESKAFTGLEGVAEGVSVKSADGEPSVDDLEFTKASASLTVIDSHTFANLSGIHYTSSDPDRTKLTPQTDSYNDTLDPGEVLFLEEYVDYTIALTVTEKEISVTLSVPDCEVEGAKVTIDVSEFPADRTPTDVGGGDSIWGAERSTKSTEVTFTYGGETHTVNLVVNYTDEYNSVYLSAKLDYDNGEEPDAYLGEWYGIEFQRLSGVIA